MRRVKVRGKGRVGQSLDCHRAEEEEGRNSTRNKGGVNIVILEHMYLLAFIITFHSH